jgi:hypothetical protein
MTRPSDVPDATTLTTIAAGLAGHESVLVNAQLGIGDTPPARSWCTTR